jgi:hypothetical protein
MEHARLPSSMHFDRAGQMWLIAILLAGFALRLHGLTRQDIWWDEARNLDVAMRPLAQVAVAPELDIHPPVYFWLLHVWTRVLGVRPGQPPDVIAYAGRLLSVGAGVVGITLTALLARGLASQWAGVAAAIIAAMSPFWLAESQETRMYTLGLALLALAAVAWLNVAQRHGGLPSVIARQDRGRWALFVASSAAALLTHYNAVFILVAWYLGWGVAALLQAGRWRSLRLAVLTGLATLILVAPVAPIALRQIPGYANPNLGVPSWQEYLIQNWRAYWAGYAFDPSSARGQAPLWLWATVALLVGGLIVATARGRVQPLGLGVLLTWVIAGLALYFVAVLDRGAFNVRYSSFVTPALYALAAAGLAGWAALWRPLGVVAVVAGLALWPLSVAADLYDPRFAREDISGVADWLRSHAGPNDLILVDQKYPFGLYYDRYAIDAAQTPQGSEPAPARYLFVDINTIDRRLSEWAAAAEHIYWVQWYESDTDPRRAVAFLLDKVGERGGEESFQGYSIDWWTLAPPTTFELMPDPAPLAVSFPPTVRTLEFSLPRDPVAAGGIVPVVIRWARVPGGAATRPLKARVALYDANGGRVAQADERLLNDRHVLPAAWSPDDRPLNVYRVGVPAELPAGDYSVGLLVYDADTLEPLGVVDAAGNPAGVEAAIGTVRVAAH